MPSSWVKRFGYEMAKTPTRSGIYRLKSGGYYVRTENGQRVLHGASLSAAQAVHDELRRMSRRELKPLFATFASNLFRERCLRGEIKSKATKERWKDALENQLIPAFGALDFDQFNNAKVEEWKNVLAEWITSGRIDRETGEVVRYSPETVNGWLRILQTISNIATTRLKLSSNPMDGVAMFRTGRAFTAEEPNSVPPERMALFMKLARDLYPQHYAMLLLGFVTGRRPSELRPIRRHIDVIWPRNQILIRRSNSRGKEIMDNTKTDRDVRITVPQEIMEMLKEHLQQLPHGPMRDSEFLFPGTTGGMRSRSVLDGVFKRLATLADIPHKVSPKAMRRTFNDLARAAEMKDIITKSITGHATDRMQEHYSTVQGQEQREGLARVLKMVKG